MPIRFSSIKLWPSSMSISFIGNSVLPKKDNIHLNSIGSLYYKCYYECSELTFTKQYDGDCQTTKQDGSKCDCECDAEWESKEEPIKTLSWFPHVHCSVATKTLNYIMKHYFVSFPNSGIPRSKSVEFNVWLTSS